MENICRFKKRMVFPENLSLERFEMKDVEGGCWLDNSSGGANNCLERKISNNKVVYSENADLSMSSNRQFIQDRMRHLVDAFSLRAQTTRQRLDTPATPSSIGSREAVEPLSTPPVTCEATQTQIKSPKKSNRNVIKFLRDAYESKVIDPNGRFYMIWMSVGALSVLYNAWVIPLRSTFPYQNDKNRVAWMVFDYIADFVYVLDVCLLQPRIMYLCDGFWVTDIAQTRQYYFKKKQFKFDVLSLLPLDLFYFLVGPERVILRLPRFLKMNTFWNYFSYVDKRLASPYIIRVTKTLMYMMFLIHLNACAYYSYSDFQGIGSNNFVYNGLGNAYIKCFYFATKTATSIGKNPKPTHEMEYMFMTFSWLMGVFVFALLIGQIRDIIATATRSQTEYRKLVDETLEYMRRLNLPQDVQRRVKLWFSYTWERQHTLDENRIMDCLPRKMKTDIAINVHIQVLSKVKLFADCDEALLRELVLQLKSVIYLPGDVICKKGDVGKEMYIIQSGKVEVIGTDANEVLATLSEGSVFGEISLLGIAGMSRRTADVRSRGYSNLFVLSKADLNAALSQYPEAQDLLNRKAKQLMKKNAALEEEKNKAMIVIDNPTPPQPQAKLLDAVLQVIPEDSKAIRLLRFGSRGKPRRSAAPRGGRLRHGSSSPALTGGFGGENTFLTKVTVHRTMS